MSLSQSLLTNLNLLVRGAGLIEHKMGRAVPSFLPFLPKDGAAVATMILVMVEVVVVSAAGCLGWEDVNFLAAGFLNFDISGFLTFCFISHSEAGLGVFTFIASYV